MFPTDPSAASHFAEPIPLPIAVSTPKPEGPKDAFQPGVTVTTLKTRRRLGAAARILDGALAALVLIIILEAFGIKL